MSRLVEESWKNFIDFKNYPWERIVKKSDLKDGNTYLHLAAKYRQTEMFEKKIKGEIQKNPRNSLSMTPFHIACEKGHVSIAESIIKSSIENNINLNAKDSYGKTGYHHACSRGQVKIVELLIKNLVEHKINLNAKDISGKTGFNYAYENGHVVIV